MPGRDSYPGLPRSEMSWKESTGKREDARCKSINYTSSKILVTYKLRELQGIVAGYLVLCKVPSLLQLLSCALSHKLLIKAT